MTKLFAYIKALQPKFEIPKSDDELLIMIKAWHDMIGDMPEEMIKAAVQHHAASSPFPVTVHDIRQFTVKQNEDISEQEAFNLVRKAINNSAYRAAEEFEKFSPVIKRIVGTPEQLREWGRMDVETINTVVASNFMRSYRAVDKSAKEYAALPPAVKGFLTPIADRMRLKEKTDCEVRE